VQQFPVISWKSDRWVESSRRALQLTFVLISLSALSLIYMLATGHFEVEYVFSVTSRDMPLYLKITALWGGQAGSLILWSWLMSAFATAVTFRKWDRDREFLPWVVAVTAITLAFFPFAERFLRKPLCPIMANIQWSSRSFHVRAGRIDSLHSFRWPGVE